MSKRVNPLRRFPLLAGLCWALVAVPVPAQEAATGRRSGPESRPGRPVATRTLKEVLARLEKTYRVSFAFRDRLVAGRTVPAGAAEGEGLEATLDALLGPLGLRYKKMEGDIYVIQPVEEGGFGPGRHLEGPGGMNLPEPAGPGRTEVRKTFVTVTGRVAGRAGEGLPGVNVLLKGTGAGAVTNADGAYTLTIPAEGAAGTLSFSSIGYQPREVALERRVALDVVLQPDVQSLAEVVVVGYGAVRKADLTGAAATVGRRQFGDRAVTNASQLLEGRVAGVDLTRASGAVDAGTNSKVRGTNSLSGTDPLWIVNGMPGDPNMLNPNDIESVTVLKDASATAIYGARGANGVFIVTTRGGEPGQTKVEYRGLHGVATPGRKLGLLDAPGYADLLYDIKGGAYNPETGHWEAPAGLPAKLYDPAYLRTTRTDWQDQIFRTRPLSDHHLSVSGGRDHARFKVSLGYQHQGQTGGNKVYNRLNLLVYSEYKIGKRIRLGENVAVRQVRLRGNNPDILGALRMPPAEPVFSPDDGNPGGYSLVTTPDDENDAVNPVAAMELINQRSEETKYAVNLWAELDLFKHLTFRSQAAYERGAGHWLRWNPAHQSGNVKLPDELVEGHSRSVRPQLENYLTFHRGWSTHRLTVMAGNYYYRGANGRSGEIRATGFKNFDVLLPSHGENVTVQADAAWREAHLSYFGRVNYAFRDRYLFTFNLRADGSDKFSPAHRWGAFPSFAAAWKVGEEKFLQTLPAVNELKLRASWGKSGSDAISQYLYYTNVFYGGNHNILYPFGDGSPAHLRTGATINALSTPDIRWEETTTTDVGLDLGLWRDALNLTVDYYHKRTAGILVNVPVPASTGIDKPSVRNAASVTNRGFDFTLSWRGAVRGLRYALSARGGYNRNRVVALGEGEPIVRGDFGGEVGYSTRTEAGHPIGYFWGYRTDGVIPTRAEADAYNAQLGQHAQPGDLRFRDLNGDGALTDADRTNLGDGMPDWTGGLGLNLAWKGFDLAATFQGMHGNELYNHLGVYWMQGMIRPFNAGTDVLRRWKAEGDVTDVPRAAPGDPNRNLRSSDRYVKDGSYLRLQTLTLGYSLPAGVRRRLKAGTFRLFVTCENLRTWTRYPGYHPDVYRWGNFERGVDVGAIPLPRTFTGGLQVGF